MSLFKRSVPTPWNLQLQNVEFTHYMVLKLGLYRLPFRLDDPLEIKSIHDGLKSFEMEVYDRIFATYN